MQSPKQKPAHPAIRGKNIGPGKKDPNTAEKSEFDHPFYQAFDFSQNTISQKEADDNTPVIMNEV